MDPSIPNRQVTRAPHWFLAAVAVTLGWGALLLGLVTFIPDDWHISGVGRAAYGITALAVAFLCFLVTAALWSDRG